MVTVCTVPLHREDLEENCNAKFKFLNNIFRWAFKQLNFRVRYLEVYFEICQDKAYCRSRDPVRFNTRVRIAKIKTIMWAEFNHVMSR